jgi:hypothetical protein
MHGVENLNTYDLALNPFVLSNTNGSSQTVTTPTEANINAALEALSTVPAGSSGNTEWAYQTASTMTALSASLSMNGTAFGTTFGADSSITTESTLNLVAVQVETKYFSINMEVEGWEQPSDILSPTVTLEEVQDAIPTTDLPLIVTGVTYGHQAYIVARTSSTASDFQAAVQASYAAAQTGGTVSANYQTILNDATIEGGMYGVDVQSSVNSLDGFASVNDFFQTYINANPNVVGIIGFFVKTLLNQNASVPGGAVSIQLTSPMVAEWKSGGTEDSDNLKLFGLLQVQTLVNNSGATTVWAVNNLTSEPSKADPTIWAEMTSKNNPTNLDFHGEDTDSYTFAIDPVDGQCQGYGDLWDYYSGSSNEELGTASTAVVSYTDFGDGATVSQTLTPSSGEWGSCEVTFTFTLVVPG